MSSRERRGSARGDSRVMKRTPIRPQVESLEERVVLSADIQFLPDASSLAIAPTEGSTFQGQVASFSVSNPNTPASALAATINWGDGSSSAGTVAANGPGAFNVTGSHSYSAEGNYPLSVTVQEKGFATPPTDGLVSWYRAEGNANDSAGTNNGTIQGGVSFAPGISGQAFQLNGTDGVVTLPDNLFPFPTTGTGNDPFSFSTWFETTSDGVILGQQNGVPFGDQHGHVPAVMVGNDGHLYTEFFWNNSVSMLVSPNAVNDGQFHHFALSYDGTQQVAYLDGNAIGSESFTQVAYADSYQYQLGTGFTTGWPASNQDWFTYQGLIDETMVYNRALSASEVQAIHNSPFNGQVVDTESATGTAAVADAPVHLTGVSFGPTEAQQFKGVVATFTDPGGAEALTDYAATINWGDGSAPSTGTLVANTDGSFSVSGQHTYAEEGGYVLSVIVTHDTAPAATANEAVVVADSVPVVAITATRTPGRNVDLFAAYADLAKEGHTLQVDWGDGSHTQVDLGTHKYGDEVLSHHYSPGTHSATITVTVADDEGTTSTPESVTVQFSRYGDPLASAGWSEYYAEIARMLAQSWHHRP